MAVQQVAQRHQAGDKQQMREEPGAANWRSPNGGRGGPDALSPIDIGEQGNRRRKSDQVAKSPMLPDAHQRAQAGRRLRKVEVDEGVEKNLLGYK